MLITPFPPSPTSFSLMPYLVRVHLLLCKVTSRAASVGLLSVVGPSHVDLHGTL
jgi:hypothetical protein